MSSVRVIAPSHQLKLMEIELTYRRLSHAELDRLEADPEQAVEYLSAIPPGLDLTEIAQTVSSDLAAEQARVAKMMAAFQAMRDEPTRVELDKNWHALHFLLTGDASLNPEHRPNDPLHNLVMGGKPTSLEASYGQVRKFEHDDITRIVAALENISVDDLRARFSAEAFNAAEIYPKPSPGGWDLKEVEGVFEIFPKLRQLFVDALNAGDIVIVYD
jgi:Domain of unknown function (DUF1877)